jgi:hypothetical protein
MYGGMGVRSMKVRGREVQGPLRATRCAQQPKTFRAARECRSRVAQWLACWAHNPKVRGSGPHFNRALRHASLAPSLPEERVDLRGRWCADASYAGHPLTAQP